MWFDLLTVVSQTGRLHGGRFEETAFCEENELDLETAACYCG